MRVGELVEVTAGDVAVDTVVDGGGELRDVKRAVLDEAVQGLRNRGRLARLAAEAVLPAANHDVAPER